jgi:hypothetical protein
MTTGTKMAHLFHWPSFGEYQQNLVQIIALPIGAKGNLYYSNRWINKTFADEVQNINANREFGAIFWVLSCTQNKKLGVVSTSFDYAIPVRLINILNVSANEDYQYVSFTAAEFVKNIEKIDSKTKLENYMNIVFIDPDIPCPGVEKGFAYAGPKVANIETAQMLSLETLYAAMENIPCSIDYKEGTTIKDYPLVAIKSFQNLKADKSGLYELLVDREYRVALSYYQGEPFRNRFVFINEERFVGKSNCDEISVGTARKGQTKTSIEMKCNNICVQIPLFVTVKTPWYQRKYSTLILVIVISAIAFLTFTWLYPDSDAKMKAALLSALIVLIIGKIWETFAKSR